jgi:protein-tyrosine phosphatase
MLVRKSGSAATTALWRAVSSSCSSILGGQQQQRRYSANKWTSAERAWLNAQKLEQAAVPADVMNAYNQLKKEMWLDQENFYCRIDPELMSMVVPGVYLSGIDAARDYAAMKANSISRVVGFGTQKKYEEYEQYEQHPDYIANAPELNIDVGDHLMYDMRDMAGARIEDHFDEASAFIEQSVQNGRGVLVHCTAGLSRSPSLTMAWLMKYRQMPYYEAMRCVRRARHFMDQCDPARWFRPALKRWGARHGPYPFAVDDGEPDGRSVFKYRLARCKRMGLPLTREDCMQPFGEGDRFLDPQSFDCNTDLRDGEETEDDFMNFMLSVHW